MTTSNEGTASNQLTETVIQFLLSFVYKQPKSIFIYKTYTIDTLHNTEAQFCDPVAKYIFF